MRMTIPTSWVIAALLLARSTLAAQETGEIFERLAGEWHGEGTLMGRAARFEMGWEPRGGLAVLTFENGFADPDGQPIPVLQAAAVYRTSRESPEAVWLDSRGARIEIRWTATDSTLVANWSAPREVGRTTYRMISSEEIEVVDEVASDGTLRPFATARYRRAAALP
jgi:hypothetical protein